MSHQLRYLHAASLGSTCYPPRHPSTVPSNAQDSVAVVVAPDPFRVGTFMNRIREENLSYPAYCDDT